MHGRRALERGDPGVLHQILCALLVPNQATRQSSDKGFMKEKLIEVDSCGHHRDRRGYPPEVVPAGPGSGSGKGIISSRRRTPSSGPHGSFFTRPVPVWSEYSADALQVPRSPTRRSSVTGAPQKSPGPRSVDRSREFDTRPRRGAISFMRRQLEARGGGRPPSELGPARAAACPPRQQTCAHLAVRSSVLDSQHREWEALQCPTPYGSRQGRSCSRTLIRLSENVDVRRSPWPRS